MSTREDREWDMAQDRAWLCPECRMDLDTCPGHDDEEE